jgi:hypothetical protein
LAVPFGEHREVAKALPSWEGKTVIDATNAFGLPVEELDGLPSSAFVAPTRAKRNCKWDYGSLVQMKQSTLAFDYAKYGAWKFLRALHHA